MAVQPIFRALSDPTRRDILQILRAGDLTAGAIAARFPSTAANISHHLAVLKEAGLVEDRREGKHVVYSLKTTVFQELAAWVLELVGEGEGHDSAGREAPGERGKDT